MTNYFAEIQSIPFEGQTSNNLLSYRYYNPKQMILGKSMEDHLRLAICYWHTFCWLGNDGFGQNSFDRPWLNHADPMTRAKEKTHAAFEFIQKLGLKFFTFHDRDAAPEGANLKESIENLNRIVEIMAQEMEHKKIQLLWGTANLFSHPRYMAGAATNPDPEIFAYAIAQVKSALDATQQLKGQNYVLWGGREGYDTLLNTDLRREADQYARFLTLLVDYKHKIGFKGNLLIEPKPCEPTKHQYDFDSAHVYAFLQKYNLEKEFKVNIEANHATLAGHSFSHEIAYACANDIFGSIDANRGDYQLGWDTDQFPNEMGELALAMYYILEHGGFTSGGFNFDAKVRRQSIDLTDLFYAHVSGIDAVARALLIAAKMQEKKVFKHFVDERYKKWDGEFGKKLLNGKMNIQQISQHALQHDFDPKPRSGRQEMLENLLNECII